MPPSRGLGGAGAAQTATKSASVSLSGGIPACWGKPLQAPQGRQSYRGAVCVSQCISLWRAVDVREKPRQLLELAGLFWLRGQDLNL